MNLRCKKVLITGGSSGIGLAIARRFIKAGVKVVIAGRNIEKLEKVAEEIASDRLHIMKWDVSNIDSCNEKLQEASEKMNGLDGLVNNAGVRSSDRGWEPWDITEQEWANVMDINLKAAFFIMRNAVDYMIKNETKGNILNISSNAVCMDISGAYGCSKLSLLKMTRSFGKRFGKNGIIINGISPGATFTPMISDYAHEVDQPYERHAIGRLIRPEEIAELAAYLMSDFGEIICGHTVIADGGDALATL
jgi:NAD(P)-dependent dehydrogenase (short-subunit alcohol dehydrogenase family)